MSIHQVELKIQAYRLRRVSGQTVATPSPISEDSLLSLEEALGELEGLLQSEKPPALLDNQRGITLVIATGDYQRIHYSFYAQAEALEQLRERCLERVRGRPG
jgi:hypothetical protein